MSVLKNNLNRVKEKIVTCTDLTRKILGLVTSLDSFQLYNLRDSYDSGYVFNQQTIDTDVLQSSLVDGYTIIIRFYPTEWINYRGTFGYFVNGDGDADYGIMGLQYSTDRDSSGELVFGHFPSDNTNRVFIPISLLPVNQWHTVVVSYDGQNTGRAYVSGTLVSESVSFEHLQAYQTVIIGKTFEGGDEKRYFQGTISDFKIYNKCLTDEEIAFAIAEINE